MYAQQLEEVVNYPKVVIELDADTETFAVSALHTAGEADENKGSLIIRSI